VYRYNEDGNDDDDEMDTGRGRRRRPVTVAHLDGSLVSRLLLGVQPGEAAWSLRRMRRQASADEDRRRSMQGAEAGTKEGGAEEAMETGAEDAGAEGGPVGLYNC
jgi:hypothetical protein